MIMQLEVVEKYDQLDKKSLGTLLQFFFAF